jgi:hypothetical protein
MLISRQLFPLEPQPQLLQRQLLQIGLRGACRPIAETSMPVRLSIAVTFTALPMAVNSK